MAGRIWSWGRSRARTGRASGGRLERGVGVLKPERGVVGVVEVVVGLALQGRDLVRYVGKVAGDVLCSVGVFPRLGPDVRVRLPSKDRNAYQSTI